VQAEPLTGPSLPIRTSGLSTRWPLPLGLTPQCVPPCPEYAKNQPARSMLVHRKRCVRRALNALGWSKDPFVTG
jgi:hypothetical protein